MDKFDEGLRCQDVHAGLRNLDVTSAPITQHLEDTQLIGMAATLASTIRGEDVIADAQALKVVAADQLDINPYAFNRVIELLHTYDLVRDVRTTAGKILSFSENVAYHETLYEQLGDAWETSTPDDVAVGVIDVVHRLARGPMAREDLEADMPGTSAERSAVLDVTARSELVRAFSTPDGEILYSPFHGFEHPGALVTVFSQHGNQQAREDFQKLASHQGIPVDEGTPVLATAVMAGLIPAPSVQRPDGVLQPFAFLPYTIDASFFRAKKSVLDKALAILACVRCGQHFGGVTNIRYPVALLRKLRSGAALAPHSSTRRQYDVLYRMRIVHYGSLTAERTSVRFVDTADNLEALDLAIQLALYGQPLNDRAGEAEARSMLAPDGSYLAPMQTIRDRRGKVGVPENDMVKLVEALMMNRELN